MRTIFALSLFFIFQFAQAESLIITADKARYNLSRYLTVWEDPSAQVGVSEALANQQNFEHLNADKLTRGTSQSAWWLMLSIKHSSTVEQEWLLGVDFATLDHLDVWKIGRNGQVELIFEGGDKNPFSERSIQYSSFVVPLTLQAEEETTLLIRTQTIGSLVVPLRLLSKTAFIEDEETDRLIMGGLWGGLVFLLIYNMFLYLNVRDETYIYYCAYILTFILCTMHMAGIGFHYLWSNWIWFQNGGLAILFLLSGGAANHFTRLVLELKTRHPVLDRILWSYLVFSGLCLLVFPFTPYSFNLAINALIVLTMGPVMVTAGLISFIEGYPPARYYFLAWVLFFAALTIFALEMLGVIQGTYLSKWALQIGSGTEALLYSIALSDRITMMKQQALEAQNKVIEQEKLLRSAQEEANRQLEARVEQRTLELTKTAQDLARVNEQLDRLNRIDELTQVYNRRAFNQRSSELLAQCINEQKPLSILVLDVDHFKQVNDRYGHLAGDECLRQIAKLIKELVTRPQDFVARFGGEEFVVVLYDTQKEGANHVAERIRNEVENLQIYWETVKIPITASIGFCSTVPQKEHNIEQFTAMADQGLYEAKEGGRNRVVFKALDVRSYRNS